MGNIFIYLCLAANFMMLLTACLILNKRINDRKSTEKRLTGVLSEIAGRVTGLRWDMQEAQKASETKEADLKGQISALEERLLRLEQGAVPSYTAAKKAKEELDSFNMGIAAILGYNQQDALRRKETDE